MRAAARRRRRRRTVSLCHPLKFAPRLVRHDLHSAVRDAQMPPPPALLTPPSCHDTVGAAGGAMCVCVCRGGGDLPARVPSHGGDQVQADGFGLVQHLHPQASSVATGRSARNRTLARGKQRACKLHPPSAAPRRSPPPLRSSSWRGPRACPSWPPASCPAECAGGSLHACMCVRPAASQPMRGQARGQSAPP